MTTRKSIGRYGAFAWLGAVLALTAAAPVFAHHSYGAFSMDQEAEFQGTVKRWLYTNPHSLLIVTVLDENGEEVDAPFEANGPGYLVRAGWTRHSLKAGDEVTVVAHPLKDGTPGGDIVRIVFADGQELDARLRRNAE